MCTTRVLRSGSKKLPKHLKINGLGRFRGTHFGGPISAKSVPMQRGARFAFCRSVPMQRGARFFVFLDSAAAGLGSGCRRLGRLLPPAWAPAAAGLGSVKPQEDPI